MYYLSLFLLSFNLYFKKSPSNNRKPPKFRFPTAAIHFENGEQVNPHGRVSFRQTCVYVPVCYVPESRENPQRQTEETVANK